MLNHKHSLLSKPSTSNTLTPKHYGPSTETPNNQDHQTATSEHRKNVDFQIIPSSSKPNRLSCSSIRKYLRCPGKILYKKGKAPKDPMPSVMSTKSYRTALIKNTKRKKNNEWICVYCDAEFTDDINSKSTWIECDECDIKMHVSCVPRSHMKDINFEWDGMGDGEIDFICEVCHQSQ